MKAQTQKLRISYFINLSLIFFCVARGEKKTALVHVGALVDLETWEGKMSNSCISMAVQDFYASHPNYTTRLVLHLRDSTKDLATAVSAALDLLKNVKVKAVIGPQYSDQNTFMAYLGNKAHIPFLSFSPTSFSPSIQNSYFIHTAQNDSSQARAIAALVETFSWLQVILVYEDTEDGSRLMPYLTQTLQEIFTRISYMSAISPSATDEEITIELHKMVDMPTKVFIVHASYSLGSRIFLKAKEVGMMDKGHAWIITDKLTNVLEIMNSSVLESMQGVLGMKPYVPKSERLNNFIARWKRLIHSMYPDIMKAELNVYGLWAYDTVWTLAMAAEIVESPSFHNQISLSTHGDSNPIKMGSKLRDAILSTKLEKGLSGEFRLVDGQLQSSALRVVNVIGKGGRGVGFWTALHGISQELNANSTSTLRTIFWPGEVTTPPKGLVWKKLRIGVPEKHIFTDLVNVAVDPKTNATTVSGFCIEVFQSVMQEVPFKIPYEFIPFKDPNAQSEETYYDDLIKQLLLQNYDAVVGDVRITLNRWNIVDFSLPYMGSDVAMVAPIKDDVRNDPWIFLKPLSFELWSTMVASFIFIGFVVWVLEHQINEDFKGSPIQQLGTLLWFSFSTLVYAHREKVRSNLSRFVVIIWLFLVLVISNNYAANLSSLLTVESLQPKVVSIDKLKSNGDYVGYKLGSGVVEQLLKNLNFEESKLKAIPYEDWNKALSKGSKNGGVSAIFDKIIHIRPFLRQNCDKYIMEGPTFRVGVGYGFAFPKGSPLVPYISKAILSVTETGKITEAEKIWFGSQTTCAESTPGSLTVTNYLGLFIISGFASVSALLIHLVLSFKHKRLLSASSGKPIWQRLLSMGSFNIKDFISHFASKTESTQERSSPACIED